MRPVTIERMDGNGRALGLDLVVRHCDLLFHGAGDLGESSGINHDDARLMVTRIAPIDPTIRADGSWADPNSKRFALDEGQAEIFAHTRLQVEADEVRVLINHCPRPVVEESIAIFATTTSSPETKEPAVGFEKVLSDVLAMS